MPPAQPGRFRGLFVAATLCGVLLFCAISAGGCGAPGEPTPPSPPIPAAVADLSAQQKGDAAQLIFTVPTKTITNKRLTEVPACEVYRGEFKADGSPDTKSFRMIYTLPGALVSGDIVDNRAQLLIPIAPEETREHPGHKLAYMVRTRVSSKKASADSNVVALAVYPVPEAIAKVEATVTENAIELHWPAITRTSGGEPLAAVTYRVYRGQLDPAADQGAIDAAVKDLTHAKLKAKLSLVASTDTPSERDSDFEFNQMYVYVVRSAGTAANALESGDSTPVVVSPRDTFPPAAPVGLVAAPLNGDTAGSVVVDLSWSISPENDVAGYRVYRSETDGARGEPLLPDLIPTPAFRDTAVQIGHKYRYTVTAVDRAGNESAASATVIVEISPPSS
ncbi:MAG TPA: hypothetical protein VE545_06650 [Candidatus Dormibacteraeota bacterium]|nr:hypothetical protein [Candidatus Dormibacteraeota bacterium]